MPSKADLSANWRTPRATTGSKPPANVFRAFAKKPRLVNPYSEQPHLWSDFTEYRASASAKKCELCKINVRPAVFPQVLNTCKHIFCAKCIYDHYVVANKGQCPTCAADICTPYNPTYDDERYIRSLDDRRWRFVLECAAEARSREEQELRDYLFGREEQEPSEEEEFRCRCGWGYCDGDCGTLPCGCIDTCRGKCEL
jgi:hypothetical protein